MLSRPTSEQILAQIFLDAADVIERRGLAYGQCQDATGQVCLRGAINVVLNGDANDWGGSEAVLNGLRPFTEDLHPIDWSNNWGRRTSDEVAAMLRRAGTATLMVDALWPK